MCLWTQHEKNEALSVPLCSEKDWGHELSGASSAAQSRKLWLLSLGFGWKLFHVFILTEYLRLRTFYNRVELCLTCWFTTQLRFPFRKMNCPPLLHDLVSRQAVTQWATSVSSTQHLNHLRVLSPTELSCDVMRRREPVQPACPTLLRQSNYLEKSWSSHDQLVSLCSPTACQRKSTHLRWGAEFYFTFCTHVVSTGWIQNTVAVLKQPETGADVWF